MSQELNMLTAASRKYERARRSLDNAKDEVVEAIVAALKAGETPTEVADRSPFTPAYVRRIAKDAGIPAAPRGPKPKRAES